MPRNLMSMFQRSKFPVWFPFQKMTQGSDLPLDEGTWKKYVEARLSIYNVDGAKDFRKDPVETSEEFRERGFKDAQSHMILKLGVCLDPRLSSWFVEMEGDLFSHRFQKEKWEEKKAILNYLFPTNNLEQNWMEVEELNVNLGVNVKEILGLQEKDHHRVRAGGSRYLLEDLSGLKKLIAVDFRFAHQLVKSRKIPLYQGWAIGTVEKLSSTIKSRFERNVQDSLAIFAERLEAISHTPQGEIAKEIHKILHDKIKPRYDNQIGEIILSGSHDDNFGMFPPCIQDLVSAVEKSGYIPHWERFQLGLFLKHTGMDVEEQLQYWYNKAVDNINLSFDEFKKRAGYIIRHIYGLEGGKIDYDMPSCSTIQQKMYCTFRHRDITNLKDQILTRFSEDVLKEKAKVVDEILDFSASGFPNHACGKYLELGVGQGVKTVYHPMFYLKVASSKFSKSSEDDNESASTGDEVVD